MNKINRFCKIKGHDESPIFHICTFQECNNPTRWCCVECISEEIHRHSKSNNSHIMKTKDLLLKLQSESEKFKLNLESFETRELLKTLEKIFKEC